MVARSSPRAGGAASPGRALDASQHRPAFAVEALLLVLDNCEHLLDAAARARRGDPRGVPRTCGSWRRAASRSASPASDGHRCGRCRCPADADDARRRSRSMRRGAAVRRAGRSGRARFRRSTRERGERGRRDLPTSRRDPARDRARGGARRGDEPRRDRGPPRRAVPAPHRRAPHRGGTAPDAARDGRLVLLACSTRPSGSSSTGSACSPAASTSRRPRPWSVPMSTVGSCATPWPVSCTSRS